MWWAPALSPGAQHGLLTAEVVPGEVGGSRRGVPPCHQGAGFGGTLSPMAIVGQTVFCPGPRSDGGSCRCVQREPQNLSPPGPLPLPRFGAIRAWPVVPWHPD